MIGELLDELIEVLIYELAGLLPTVVWGILGMIGAVAATATGVVIFSESTKIGGALIAVGVLLAGTVLVKWYR